MPLAVLNYRKDRVLPDMLEKLARELPEMIADALTTEVDTRGRLFPGEVEVWVRESNEFDVHVKDFGIVIWANHYPEREQDLNHRNVAILNKVREFLSDYDRNLSGYVWILLQPGSFGEI